MKEGKPAEQASILNHSTDDIWGQITLLWWGCAVHCRMLAAASLASQL